MVQFVFSLLQSLFKLVDFLTDLYLFHLKLFPDLTQDLFLLHDDVALGFNLVLKGDLVSFKLSDSVCSHLILIIELSTLAVKGFLLLVKLGLALLRKSFESISLLG